MAIFKKLIFLSNGIAPKPLSPKFQLNRANGSDSVRAFLNLHANLHAIFLRPKFWHGCRAIINIDNVDIQLEIFKRIIKDELSVRKVEELAKLLIVGNTKKAETSKPSQDPALYTLQTKLSSHFGTKVALTADSKNKGAIKIPFASALDLNRLLEILEISL